MCSPCQGIKERERYLRHFGVAPPGLPGLWSWWKSPRGEAVHSYTMLTINAEAHTFMRLFHKPTDEKRMVVILPDDP